MKVVVMGGGIISNRLLSSPHVPCQIVRFSIRDLSGSVDVWSSLINECISADLIVYLAYHHRDLPLNVMALSKLLRRLKAKRWVGRFLFFNTQSVLVRKILKSASPLPAIFNYDLYTATKKIQYSIVRKYSDVIDICEIYLPVVIGEGSKAQNRFKFIADHAAISMPMRGKHVFAYLDIDVFVAWFWGRFVDHHSERKSSLNLEQIFVYQGIRTFSDMLESVRLTSKSYPIIIDDCVHKHRFDDNMRSNLVWSLKLSPIWLLLSILRNEIGKYLSVKQPRLFAAQKPCSATKCRFIPIGPEYQYYGTSIDLNAIPFRKVKVG